MGRNKWLDKQLDPGSINDAFVEDFIADRMPNLDDERAGSLGRHWADPGI